MSQMDGHEHSHHCDNRFSLRTLIHNLKKVEQFVNITQNTVDDFMRLENGFVGI